MPPELVHEEQLQQLPARHRPVCPPSWWDRHFKIKNSYARSSLTVSLKEVGIKDDDIRSLSLALDGFLARTLNPGQALALEFDASSNELTDLAGDRLVVALQELSVLHKGLWLRVLKLHKNQVGDRTCEQLARLIATQEEAVEEIHLSHNTICQRGMASLLVAIAMHPNQAYPKLWPEALPVWMRLEHNQIANVEALLDILCKDPVRLRVCYADRSKTGISCTSFRCTALSGDSTPSASCAHVHLFCIAEQKDVGQPEADLSSLVISLADAALDGHLGDEQSGSKVRSLHCEESNHDTKSPTDAVPFRSVELNLDSESRAGLELTAGDYGYRVDGVDPEPGQQLETGDVIVEIDGVPLWGSLSEDAMDEAFGSRFAARARLLTARVSDVQARAIWRPLEVTPSFSSRCPALKCSFGDDLRILASHCGLKVEFHDSESALYLKGSPQSQRFAVDELVKLMQFYFPELVACQRPRFFWFGKADPDCSPSNDLEPTPGSTHLNCSTDTRADDPCQEDMALWELGLRHQWSEDENLYDEDLPVEPLEAPDEGPDVFEGQALEPEPDIDRPLRVVILVGLPGSGKSTLAARFGRFGWVVVNQDTLGDRRACVSSAKEALSKGDHIIIDRCNTTRLQRRVWLGVADEFEAGTACFWLDVDEETCGERVLQRFGHPTLAADSSSLQVISAFANRFEKPMEAEGFILWHIRDDGELDEAVAELREMAERSETNIKSSEEYVSSGPTRRPQKHRRLTQEAAEAGKRKPMDRKRNGVFRYEVVRGRGARALFLRAVRRQIEYYFSDANLKQDWFFQEKIRGEPELGWLELRWILSCPRIRDVHRASVEDVLEALGPSMLQVKAAHETHWVRRTRPLPDLVAARPNTGAEPDWYRGLHEEQCCVEEGCSSSSDEVILLDAKSQSAPGQPAAVAAGAPAGAEVQRCAACACDLARTNFSKAQLTKHRRSPTCKSCLTKVTSEQ